MRAFVYYRENYLMGVARPGALSSDGSHLTLQSNDLQVVWQAPVGDVRVKKGMGILTVSIKGEKASILTAVGGRTSPRPSDELTALLESGHGIADAPSVRDAQYVSWRGMPSVGAYAQGQKALRELFASLGVLD
ncbi:hypothetical protein ASD10_11885 [Aeromicrobium sp. Root472D3]|nr:hypothetical protein ASD10_11885 [Aeromicrobium sp. Root472D3]